MALSGSCNIDVKRSARPHWPQWVVPSSMCRSHLGSVVYKPFTMRDAPPGLGIRSISGWHIGWNYGWLWLIIYFIVGVIPPRVMNYYQMNIDPNRGLEDYCPLRTGYFRLKWLTPYACHGPNRASHDVTSIVIPGLRGHAWANHGEVRHWTSPWGRNSHLFTGNLST